MKFRTRNLGGTLLVIKGLNDCVTVERNKSARPCIVRVEGDWTAEERKEAVKLWSGSEAQRR